MFYQGSVAYDDTVTAANAVYREVIEEDGYGLRKFLLGLKNPDSIKTIVDIGANIGFFSLSARVLFPRARIIAIEPVLDTFEILKKNVQFFNIEAHRGALGNGSVVNLTRGVNNPTINRFTPDGPLGESIQSLMLSQIFALLRIEPPFCLKIDCEGGELWLPQDPSSSVVLQSAAHLGLEAHFLYIGEERTRWVTWFENQFGPLHQMQRESMWNDSVYTYQISQKDFLSTELC